MKLLLIFCLIPFICMAQQERVALKSADSNNSERMKVYHIVEEFPRFPGCEKFEAEKRKACAERKMANFITTKAGYPDEALVEKAEGTVFIRFEVLPTGKLENIVMVKNTTGSEALENAALSAVKSMNEMKELWIPGKNQHGEAVRVQMTIPISFHFNKKK